MRGYPELENKVHLRTIAVSLLWLCPTVSAPAQNNPAQFPWSVTAQAFVTRFHADLGYAAGNGIAAVLGRSFANNRLAFAFGVSRARATKSLILIDGEHETGAAGYHVFIATRALLQPTRVLPMNVFVDFQAGWLHFRPRAFRFRAGALGEITMQPPHENKFAPAWGAGLQWRITSRFSALAQFQQHFIRAAIVELGRNMTRQPWRPFYLYGAGFSAAF